MQRTLSITLTCLLVLIPALVLILSLGQRALADELPAGTFQGLAQPVPESLLESTCGKYQPFNPDALFGESTVTGNQVIYQGDIEILQYNVIENAFNQSSGVFTIVQNSGNNALIQTATIVNINFY